VAGGGQVRVEVVIERHANARIVSGELQDLRVLGAVHADFGDMHGVEPLPAKDGGRTGSEPLVEKDSFHATRSVLSRSSSTVAAA
jgi:hypothetical protein